MFSSTTPDVLKSLQVSTSGAPHQLAKQDEDALDLHRMPTTATRRGNGAKVQHVGNGAKTKPLATDPAFIAICKFSLHDSFVTHILCSMPASARPYRTLRRFVTH